MPKVEEHNQGKHDAENAETSSRKKVSHLYPVMIIVMSFLIYYFSSRYIGGVFAALYPLARGWNEAQIMAWFKTTTGQFWAITFVYGSIVVLIAGALRMIGLQFKDIGLKKPKWMDISYALSGFAVYFVLFVVISVAVKALFPDVNFNQKQQIGFETAREFSQLSLVFLSLVIVPPIVEEILFRGFLYTGMRKKWPLWSAAIITSILFAIVHLQFGSGAPLLWVAAIDTFVLSLVLVYLREKTGSLGAPILLHMLKNGLAFTLLFVIGVR